MNRFKNFLSYTWHYYLLIAAAAILFWTAAFNLKNSPARDEKVRIFISAYRVDTEGMEKYLERFAERKIKNVEVDYSYYGDRFFNYVFLTRGLTSSDLIITNEGNLRGINLNNYYVPFPRVFSDQYLENGKWEYLEEDGEIFGIEVYGEDVNLLSEYIDYEGEDGEDKFYLLVNRNSVYFKNSEMSIVYEIIGRILANSEEES